MLFWWKAASIISKKNVAEISFKPFLKTVRACVTNEMSPPGQFFFPSCHLSSEDSRQIHIVTYQNLHLSWLKKFYFVFCSAFFTKLNTRTKHIFFMFFNNEICYLNYDIKHFFFFYKHRKHVFQQYFLNHSFHIFLNNNFWNTYIINCVPLKYSFIFFSLFLYKFPPKKKKKITIYIPFFYDISIIFSKYTT